MWGVLAEEAVWAGVAAFGLGLDPEDVAAKTEFAAELDVFEAGIVLWLLRHLPSFFCGGPWCCAKLSVRVGLDRVATLAGAEGEAAGLTLFADVEGVAEVEGAVLVLAPDVEHRLMAGLREAVGFNAMQFVERVQ